MGTFHHGFAIAVVEYNHEQAARAFAKVKDFAASAYAHDVPLHPPYHMLLVGPIAGVANHSETYFMAPDGSKEGWATSDEADAVREFFVQTMREAGADVVEGSWGELTPTFSAMED